MKLLSELLSTGHIVELWLDDDDHPVAALMKKGEDKRMAVGHGRSLAAALKSAQKRYQEMTE